ncbi:MAG TPA: phosphatase PAP2-related protein [Candidatus Paceibacterota bacterium]|nr:phosphatase PAP2-related protein [Candidatus Paceibacterota bacterium]
MTESPEAVPLHRHNEPHREIARRYRHTVAQRHFRFSIFSSFLFLTLCFGVNLLAIQYATESVSNSVTDIVLSNVRVFDVDGLFVYGTFLFIGVVVFILLAHPKRIPFTLYSLGIFWIVRSGFTSLTHIAPFAQQAAVQFGPTITKAFFGGDLFFSGHAGTPFLFALIFWREKGLRMMFLAWAVYFAIIVLLGHLHYSIDVAAAFFITYTIFCFCEWLLPNERALFFTEKLPE